MEATTKATEAMGQESQRIERPLNGKAKPRLEPSSHGIDQRREATAEMGSEASGGAAERMGVERNRSEMLRYGNATMGHDATRWDMAERCAHETGQGNAEISAELNEMATTGIGRTESIRN